MNSKLLMLAAVAAAAVTWISPAGAQTVRKNHVGHYTQMLRYKDSQADMLYVVRQAGHRGIMKRYTWRQLEPSYGVYNFTELKSDLDFARAYGMQFSVMIEDKTFNSEKPHPDYLGNYFVVNKDGGYTAIRWNTYVESRYKALITAMAKAVGSHPALEAIALQETASGLTSTQKTTWGYTPEKLRDTYIREIRHIGTSMPTVRTWWYANYFEGNMNYVGAVLDATKDYGVVLGNPDIWPENKDLVRLSYPFYDAYQWKVPLMAQIEQPCYIQVHSTTSATKYWTPKELFDYGKNQLHLDYVVWVAVQKEQVAGAYDWFDALPVIANNPPPFNP